MPLRVNKYIAAINPRRQLNANNRDLNLRLAASVIRVESQTGCRRRSRALRSRGNASRDQRSKDELLR